MSYQRDVLRRPPRGFEEVVRQHFVLNRPLIERQCAAWLDECRSPSNKLSMERAYAEILRLIDQASGADAASASASASSSAEVNSAAAGTADEGLKDGAQMALEPAPPPPAPQPSPPTAPPPVPAPAAPSLTQPSASSAASSASGSAFESRLKELFASFVAAGQDATTAAALALQQVQAEQGGNSPSAEAAAGKNE